MVKARLYQGIDLVSVRRIEKALASQGKRFLSRIFTSRELAYCLPRRMKCEHLAARFAAKEAFLKAFTPEHRGVPSLKDLEVRRHATGQPYFYLSAAVKKKIGFPKEMQIELSLAHEREFAVAVVMLYAPGAVSSRSRRIS